MHLVGLLGMPRRVYTYVGHEKGLGRAESPVLPPAGSIMTIGIGVVVIDLIAQICYGRRIRRDPWRAATLEWAMPIPPTPYAFASIPRSGLARRPHPSALAPSLARGEGYLGFARNGWQETLGVHMTTGRPEQLILLPRQTYLPLFIALATAAAVLAMLFQLYSGLTRDGVADGRVVRVLRGRARAYPATMAHLMSAGASICHPIQRWPIHRRGGP